MKGLLRVILIVTLLLASSAVGHCQAYIVMSNGYLQTYSGLTYPTGSIVDDGDTTGNYSNGFYGEVAITVNMGDTIIVNGSYHVESNFDFIYVYDNSGTGAISSWSGSGFLTDTTYTGYLKVAFSSDGSVNYDGFLLNYEVRPSNCTSTILTFSANDVGATSVELGWVAVNPAVSFRLHYGSVDTTVTGSSFVVDGLSPNTTYTFTLTPLADLGNDDCSRTLTVQTTRFPALVSGLRPLCGLDTVALTADTADAYLWSTGATTRTIEVTDTGWYSLVAFTNGCGTDTIHFRVGNIELDIETHLPTSLCAGDSALITVGMAAGSSIQVLRGESTLSESSRIFLPDGQYCEPNGCSYRSELVFSGFENSAHISDVNDIRYVMLNIEHSYIGDIYINITCPNNQSADILRYGGSGSSSCNSSIATSSRGWQSGSNVSTSTYLGVAADYESYYETCDSTATDNEPGVGWRYCWSNCTDAGFTYAAGDGLIYRSSNYNSYYATIDSSNVAAGTHFYHPDNSFSNLVGCPMNGTWYIEVIDGWSGDNGYIFGWELALNPERLSRTEYVPTVAYADLGGEYVARRSDTSFMVTAPLNRTTDTTITYTVRITDSIGCVFDTAITLIFHPSSNSYVYDTVDENNLPRTYNGRTFYNDASDVAFHYPNSSGCDSLVIYNLFVRRNSYASFDTSLCSSRLPLQWYHRTFTAAGTQYDTIVNHLGADSILTLTLNILPSIQVNIDDTICSNQSLTFEGTTYTSAGNYPHQFFNSQGCDSTRTLHLVVLNTSSSDTFATACDQFTWHGTSFASSQNGTYTTLNSLGCDSTVTLHLTVHNSYTVGISDTLCQGGSLSFGGQTLSTTGTYTHTFTSAEGCDSTVTIGLTVNPVTYFDYYDTCLENSLPRTFNTITAIGDTTVTLTLTNSNGCDSLLTYHLHVLRNSYATFDTALCADIFPIQWYHRIFYSGGTQYDTITNHLGADSLLTLTMRVLPLSYDTVVVSVCDNPYLWHDSLYSFSTTTAQYTTTNAYGCDSIVSLHLTVNYSTDTFIVAEACDSYNWFGTNYLVPPASVPTHTIANAVGCDSTLYLSQLTLHYSQYIYDADTVCQTSLVGGYPWRDTILNGITSNSSFILARTDQYGCDSMMFLNLTVYDSNSATIFDTLVQNQAATWQYNGIPLSTDTIIQLTLTNRWGCDSLITYHLHVWQNVYNTIDTTICDNQLPTFTWHGMPAADSLVATLQGSHGVDSIVTLRLHVNPTYQTVIYDTICDNQSYQFAGQTLTSPGDYSHSFTSAQGCDSTVTLTLTVHPTYSLHFYDTIYVGDTIFFEGSAYIQPGDYPVLLQTAAGCDSLLTLHLEGRNLLAAARTDSVCEGDTFYFCGNPLTEAGVYVDTVYSGDFFAGDTIVTLTLVVVPTPQASIRRSFECTPPAHYILLGSSTVPYMRWQGLSSIEGHEFDSIIAVPNPADTSIISLYVDYRPDPMCPLIIDEKLPPIPTLNALIDVRPSALTLDDRHLTARNVSEGIITGHLWYIFYNDDPSFTDTSKHLQLNVPMYVDSLMIALRVNNEMCSDTDTVRVEVLRADILFPNVFTPSLESNNLFRAYTTAVSDFELWVYDRRGNLVFHTTDIEEGWDGTHNGEPLPQAAYVYRCRYRDQITPNGYQALTGTVTLLR